MMRILQYLWDALLTSLLIVFGNPEAEEYEDGGFDDSPD